MNNLKIFYLLLILTPLTIFGAPLFHPAAATIAEEGFFLPDTFWFNIRAKVDYVDAIKERLRFSGISKEKDYHDLKIKSESIDFALTLNIKERFDLYGSVGGMQKRGNFEKRDDFFHFQSAFAPFYNIGFRLTPIIAENTLFGIDARYTYFNSDLKKIHHSNRRVEFNYHDYQIGGGVGQIISCFIPYVGIVWRHVNATFHHLFSKKGATKIEEKNPWGVAVGSSIKFGQKCFFNLELRAFNELTFSISGEFRF